MLLEQYRNNLDSWRNATRTQYRTALMTLAARVGLLLLLLAAVFVAGELWKRAVFNYVQETRRRHQLLLVRRIVMWVVALAIVGIAFATEASSFATFAGLLTAGVAVAMQSVLVSIVGYFFLIGKYGLRVGDRVQIANVTGEVIDLGHRAPAFDGDWPAGRPDGPRRRLRQLGRVSSGRRHLQADSGRQPRVARADPRRCPTTATTPRSKSACSLLRTACSRTTGTISSARRASCEERRRRAMPRRRGRHVQLRFSSGSIDAIVRYPVPLQRAAEVEERMSRALLDALRDSAAGAGAAHGATHVARFDPGRSRHAADLRRHCSSAACSSRCRSRLKKFRIRSPTLRSASSAASAIGTAAWSTTSAAV